MFWRFGKGHEKLRSEEGRGVFLPANIDTKPRPPISTWEGKFQWAGGFEVIMSGLYLPDLEDSQATSRNLPGTIKLGSGSSSTAIQQQGKKPTPDKAECKCDDAKKRYRNSQMLLSF